MDHVVIHFCEHCITLCLCLPPQMVFVVAFTVLYNCTMQIAAGAADCCCFCNVAYLATRGEGQNDAANSSSRSTRAEASAACCSVVVYTKSNGSLCSFSLQLVVVKREREWNKGAEETALDAVIVVNT